MFRPLNKRLKSPVQKPQDSNATLHMHELLPSPTVWVSSLVYNLFNSGTIFHGMVALHVITVSIISQLQGTSRESIPAERRYRPCYSEE